jgi:hypothetical protein
MLHNSAWLDQVDLFGVIGNGAGVTGSEVNARNNHLLWDLDCFTHRLFLPIHPLSKPQFGETEDLIVQLGREVASLFVCRLANKLTPKMRYDVPRKSSHRPIHPGGHRERYAILNWLHGAKSSPLALMHL